MNCNFDDFEKLCISELDLDVMRNSDSNADKAYFVSARIALQILRRYHEWISDQQDQSLRS